MQITKLPGVSLWWKSFCVCVFFLIKYLLPEAKDFFRFQSALHEARWSEIISFSMLSYPSDNFWHGRCIRVNLRSAILQTVWIQIWSNKLLDLIMIQTVYHSDGIPKLNQWNATLEIML